MLLGLTVALRAGNADVGVDQVLAAPDAVVTTLDGDTGTLRVVYSAELGQAGLVGSELDAAGEDRTYALWALLVTMQRRQACSNRTRTGRCEQCSTWTRRQVTRWGVTVEPDGGSPRPTGEVLYSGAA